MSRRCQSSTFLFGALFLVPVSWFVWLAQDETRLSAAPLENRSAQNSSEQKQDEPRKKSTLADFMREKMDASHEIMEGLLTEDGKRVGKAAEKLRSMSDAERWRVSNDIMYRNHSEDFRRSVDKLIAASKGNSIDRAALSWFDVTLSCIDCHRYVRTVLIAENE